MLVRESQMEDTKDGVKWAVSANVRATYTADGAVLLDINKGICYSLDAVASRLWIAIEASQAGITLEGIVNSVATHFRVRRDELQGDTAEWLDKLQQMGLLHCNGQGVLAKGARQA